MRINIVQQCRAEDLEEVRRIYEEGGIRAELSLFFTDMDIRLATAHLVIARAGAGSIAEIQAAARSAILVPYPGSYLDHQLYNGLSAEKAGFAWCVVQELFTATWLQEKIMGFLENPEVLKNTACNAKESAAFSYQTLLGIVMSCR
jgi:UDP-N-acetylglucosamine--N-acetylmuramyl-(pentapeptide) pyrophosphoryl-undecaprenol N-acetylglucosamine transferase